VQKQQEQVAAPQTVFISYAHKDEMLCNELKKHLSLMQRKGVIATWYDRQIMPGSDWSQDIDRHLNTASLVLLLISSDFLASDFCYTIELQHALNRHKRGEAYVVPIILRPVDWAEAPFAHLQCLPRDAKPVTEWEDQDIAFSEIASDIRKMIENPHLPLAAPLGNAQQISTVGSQNRQRLLKRVRTFWIKGVLEQSL
jgi:hypothetical protein